MSENMATRLRDRAQAITESPMLSTVRNTLEWQAAEYIECLQGAIKSAIGALDDPTGGTHVEDMRQATKLLRDALND